jgi:2-succinyl-6-hydroxy-2,4-cyclohexadiene-1-carboxylate synthase
MSAICFLHGFLGSSEDWIPIFQELKGDFHFHAINYAGLSLSEIKTAIEKLNPAPQFFVGYSMGGRILLKLHLAPSVIFSAHLGLSSESERKERWKIDSKWIEMLKTKPLSEFYEAWYAQDLFTSLKGNRPLFEEMMQRRKNQDPKLLAKTLENHSLAHDPPYPLFPELLFAYGEKDLKFRDLYLTLQSAVKIKNAGHVLHLENPKACADIIKGFIYGRSERRDARFS